MFSFNPLKWFKKAEPKKPQPLLAPRAVRQPPPPLRPSYRSPDTVLRPSQGSTGQSRTPVRSMTITSPSSRRYSSNDAPYTPPAITQPYESPSYPSYERSSDPRPYSSGGGGDFGGGGASSSWSDTSSDSRSSSCSSSSSSDLSSSSDSSSCSSSSSGD